MDNILPNASLRLYGEGVSHSLCAVVCHIGRAHNSGHYVVYTTQDAGHTWWKFDDNLVSEVPRITISKLQVTIALYKRIPCPLVTSFIPPPLLLLDNSIAIVLY